LDEFCKNPVVAERAKQSVSLVGQAVPLKDLAATGIDVSMSTDRLLLVAGAGLLGFEQQSRGTYFQKKDFLGDEWLVTADLEGPEDLVLRAMECYANKESVPIEELTQSVAKMLGEALSFEDRCMLAQRLVEGCKNLRCLDGDAFLWTGSYGDKAVRILEASGEPMHRDELAEAVEPSSLRGVVSSYQEDERVMAVGLQMYGLAAWGMEEYTKTVDHMIEVLEREGGGPYALSELAVELFGRFRINEQSITIQATTDPHFIREGDVVRLRTEFFDVELPRLEETFAVVRMGDGEHKGKWAFRIDINADHLRGTGTEMPATFARQLGIGFGERVSLSTNIGENLCTWERGKGSYQSIKSDLEHWGAEVGDAVFLIATNQGEAHFEFVSIDGMPSGSKEKLLTLMGADPRGDLVKALTQSLGLEEGTDGYILGKILKKRASRHSEKEESTLVKKWFFT